MQRTLTVTRKTGFAITHPDLPVNIRDDRGILFYTTEPILPVYDFNLPPGKYMVDTGTFKPMQTPVHFKLAKLPPSEVMLPIAPYDFEIVFAENPNKCTIFWKEKMIVFDNSFLEAPYPELYFIYFHELGHSRYGYEKKYSMADAEKYCDLYASNKMLEMGFNPSQIKAAPENTLSSRQNYRKDFIGETLLNNAYL